MIQNKEQWLEQASKRIKVPKELIEKAFKNELDGSPPIDAPLEVPDIMDITYKYSYGGISRFFREIRDNKQLYGSRCTHCGKVWLPPRINCNECYAPTEWQKLGDSAEVATYTIVYYGTSTFYDRTPYVCAFVKVDGADTLIMQNIFLKDIKKAKVGLKVKVQFKEQRNGDMGDFWYVPADEVVADV
jgi:uncharacterized OB-fold protein